MNIYIAMCIYWKIWSIAEVFNPSQHVGTKMCLVGAYLQHKLGFLTIIQSCETVPNVKISNFRTFLGAEAIQKVPHCSCK